MLPDHIHCIWRLPSGDSDYSTRWRLIKGHFSIGIDKPANERGEKKIWQIVGEPEADAARGKISVNSPIARALIGQIRGATVDVETPRGVKTYKVRNVEWLENGRAKRERT